MFVVYKIFRKENLVMLCKLIVRCTDILDSLGRPYVRDEELRFFGGYMELIAELPENITKTERSWRLIEKYLEEYSDFGSNVQSEYIEDL